MKFRIIIQPPAFDDLDETYVYLAKRYSPESAGAWHSGCIDAMQALVDQPQRHALARESAKLGVEIRQMLYRRHRSVYRILFTIEQSAVRVLCIRHAARDELTAEDVSTD
ncbi:MAG: type II toxin-antitoxin system RelE/ParE family toxin [Pirellulales bacterium]|nr:type II toxin-antitoxin system RelE/ParE family toxin [Pirellulales bacterium]